MGCPLNHGPLLVMDYIKAPNIWRYQNRTLILGIIQLAGKVGGVHRPLDQTLIVAPRPFAHDFDINETKSPGRTYN